VAAILVLVPVLLAATGCGATRLSLRLAPEELRMVRAERLPLVVGVEWSSQPSPPCGPTLVELLRATNLFREVNYFESLSAPPDLIARVERRCHENGGGWVPILPLLTLGIVPQWYSTGYGYAFTLRSPRSADQVVIDCRPHEGAYLMGWAATLLSLSPDWTLSDTAAETNQRHYDRLARDLLVRRQQIERLLGGPVREAAHPPVASRP